MAKKSGGRNYALKSQGGKQVAAPKLPYEPRDPKRYRPAIALIGCGGISVWHLRAYRQAGYRVTMLCDKDESRAQQRRDEFFPKAEVCTDFRQALKRDDIEVVDVATHPEERAPILVAALEARKHVLSQKPFVVDLNLGKRLVQLAQRRGVKLAVNQNGRWAPHLSYIRQAIARGVIGDVSAAHLSVHWNHNWVRGTPFDRIRHVVLYDFAIHWFDILTCIMGDKQPKRVYASFARSPHQTAAPPMLAQAAIEYEGAQATLVFDADTLWGPQDRTFVVGHRGTIASVGPSLDKQSVTLQTRKGLATPKLNGAWFPAGFHGTMAELLCAIEEDRQPSNSGADNLRSLALCFAALASAERGRPVRPGEIIRPRPSWVLP